MKKIITLLIALSLFPSCENEPLESELIQQGEDDGNDEGDDGSESDDLTLSIYELDTKVNFDFFGTPFESVTNSDLNISNNLFVSATNAFSVNGSSFETENQVITRNTSGQITSDTSVNSNGVNTNEYLITYTDGKISQITYDYFEDDEDDYTYNFIYEGNTINRTEVGSSISTVFTIDGFDRVIEKESFDSDFSIQLETITYNGEGNINSSVTSGELDNTTSYNFDINTNPLKLVYENNYLLGFLTDDYSDEIGQRIAQFHSANNWNGATFNGETFTFNLEYNTAGRISSRTIIYDFDDSLAFEIKERFKYVN